MFSTPLNYAKVIKFSTIKRKKKITAQSEQNSFHAKGKTHLQALTGYLFIHRTISEAIRLDGSKQLKIKSLVTV